MQKKDQRKKSFGILLKKGGTVRQKSRKKDLSTKGKRKEGAQGEE